MYAMKMAELVTRTRTLEQMKKDAFDEMAETWPSGVVSRTKIEIFFRGNDNAQIYGEFRQSR